MQSPSWSVGDHHSHPCPTVCGPAGLRLGDDSWGGDVTRSGEHVQQTSHLQHSAHEASRVGSPHLAAGGQAVACTRTSTVRPAHARKATASTPTPATGRPPASLTSPPKHAQRRLRRRGVLGLAVETLRHSGVRIEKPCDTHLSIRQRARGEVIALLVITPRAMSAGDHRDDPASLGGGGVTRSVRPHVSDGVLRQTRRAL
jgi:hypothetical protein